jgi:hypothetical protein
VLVDDGLVVVPGMVDDEKVLGFVMAAMLAGLFGR